MQTEGRSDVSTFCRAANQTKQNILLLDIVTCCQQWFVWMWQMSVPWYSMFLLLHSTPSPPHSAIPLWVDRWRNIPTLINENRSAWVHISFRANCFFCACATCLHGLIFSVIKPTFLVLRKTVSLSIYIYILFMIYILYYFLFITNQHLQRFCRS